MRIYLLVAALFHASNAARNTSQLSFSFITSLTGDFVASGGITAVDIALEQINRSPEILPYHTLGYTEILDSNVNGTLFKIFACLSAYIYVCESCGWCMYTQIILSLLMCCTFYFICSAISPHQ